VAYEKPSQIQPGLTGRSNLPTATREVLIDNPLAYYNRLLTRSALQTDITKGVTEFPATVLLALRTDIEKNPLFNLINPFKDLFNYSTEENDVPMFICWVPSLDGVMSNPMDFYPNNMEKFIRYSMHLKETRLFRPADTLVNTDRTDILRSLGVGSKVTVTFQDSNNIHGHITAITAVANADISVSGQAPSARGAYENTSRRGRLVSSAGQAIEAPCPDLFSPEALLMQDLAERLGLDPNVLLAISRVESGGIGADALRFEPHLFLKEQPNASIPYTRGDSNCPDNWTRAGGCVPFVSYQPEETGQAAFEKAYAINPQAALKSTSFGSFQVIPFKELSYLSENPEQFLTKFREDPLALSYELLEARLTTPSNGVDMISAAKRGDWTAFAVGYNGTQQAKHGYDAKLQATYNLILDQGCFPSVSVA
tara:strand:- start:1380 stop:2654 length:1275 start_codon:yes stop_codon:yes gene_type:complete